MPSRPAKLSIIVLSLSGLLMLSGNCIGQQNQSPLLIETCESAPSVDKERRIVVLKYLVDEAHTITSIEIVKSSANESADQLAKKLLSTCTTSQNFRTGTSFQESIALWNGKLSQASLPMYNLQKCAPTEADYPRRARSRNEQGLAKVQVVFDQSGSITSTSIVKSSGSQSLDQKSMEMVRKCGFLPGFTSEGSPFGASVVLDYAWRLEE